MHKRPDQIVEDDGEHGTVLLDGLSAPASVQVRNFTPEVVLSVLGINDGSVVEEFLSCCSEILNIIDTERVAQGRFVFSANELIIFVHEMYRTYLDFRGKFRKDGSGSFESHLCGTVKNLVQMEGLVGLPTVLAALKHDNLEDLIDKSFVEVAGKEAEARFKSDPKWSEAETDKRRGNFVEVAKIKAKKKEERRLTEELIATGDYLQKLSGDVLVERLNELIDMVRTLVEGVTKFRKESKVKGTAEATAKAAAEATADATFKRLLQVALEAIRTIYVKLADRAHNVATISAHTREAQERIMAETEVQYLPLARILRIRKMVQFYVEQCGQFFNRDLCVEFAELAIMQRKNIDAVKRQEILEFFKGKVLSEDSCAILKAEFVNLDFADYAALVDKPLKDMNLRDLSIGSFDPMEEILITIDLKDFKDSRSRLFALKQLAAAIEQKFAPDYTSKFNDSISYVGDPDNILGMKAISFGKEFGHLRFRINDRFSEARSKRGVLAEAASQDTPEDIKEMIRAVLSKIGPFHGLKDIRQIAQVELLKPRITVQTPKGDVYSLPRGSIGLDFAAAIHGRLVYNMSGLLEFQDLNDMKLDKAVDQWGPLEDGKVYKVQTDETHRPQPEWLLFVNTIAARAIRGYLSEISSPDGSYGKQYLQRLSEIFNIPVDELAQVIGKRYNQKSSVQILQNVGTGVINPVFVLAEYIELRNKRWECNVKDLSRWRDDREGGVSEDVITSDINKELDCISKWEVEVCVPEAAGSLSDFKTEFRREVGIKISPFMFDVPGQGDQLGRPRFLFNLKGSEISVYDFFVKLVKLNFKYPVRSINPIVKKFRQMKAYYITQSVVVPEVGVPGNIEDEKPEY